MPDKNNRVPDLLVEQLALGELSGAKKAEVISRLEKEPGGLQRLKEIEESNRRILADLPPEKMAESITRRAENQRRVEAARADSRKTRRSILVAAPLVAAAAIILIVLLPGIRTSIFDGGSGVRFKGDQRLVLHKKVGSEAITISNGDRAAAGDVLQLSYVGAGAKYGIIFSIDGRGAVTLHYPRSPQAPTSLEKGTVTLPYAYELDDAPNFERFFFVTSDKPINTPEVLSAARTMAEPKSGEFAPGPGLQVADFLLLKP